MPSPAPLSQLLPATQPPSDHDRAPGVAAGPFPGPHRAGSDAGFPGAAVNSGRIPSWPVPLDNQSGMLRESRSRLLCRGVNAKCRRASLTPAFTHGQSGEGDWPTSSYKPDVDEPLTRRRGSGSRLCGELQFAAARLVQTDCSQRQPDIPVVYVTGRSDVARVAGPAGTPWKTHGEAMQPIRGRCARPLAAETAL